MMATLAAMVTAPRIFRLSSDGANGYGDGEDGYGYEYGS